MDRKTRLNRIKQIFTAIHASRYDTPFSLQVYFKVGQQSFKISEDEGEDEAEWIRDQLAAAIDRAARMINKWGKR